MPQSAFRLHLVIALHNAAAHVAIEAFGSHIVKLQPAFHLLALAGSRHEKGRVAAYLEEYFLVVGIFHVPNHMHLVAIQAVGHGQIETVGILLECLLAFVQGKGDAAVGLVDERKLCVAGKAVPPHVVFPATDAAGVFPQSAHDGEENGRVAVPILLVAVPEIFLAFGIPDALKFGPHRSHTDGQFFVFDLFHDTI